MKRHTVECDCERGGDCTKTTVCAIDSALQDQAEEYEYRIAELEEALRSIIGQTDDQFHEGIWREVNSTALAAIGETE